MFCKTDQAVYPKWKYLTFVFGEKLVIIWGKIFGEKSDFLYLYLVSYGYYMVQFLAKVVKDV